MINRLRSDFLRLGGQKNKKVVKEKGVTQVSNAFSIFTLMKMNTGGFLMNFLNYRRVILL